MDVPDFRISFVVDEAAHHDILAWNVTAFVCLQFNVHRS